MNQITIQDFACVHSLSQLTWAPDGKKAAFVVSKADVKANKYHSYIWILEDNKVRRLTGTGAERNFYWLDNDTLVFPGDRTGKYKNNEGKKYTVFNKINVYGGEAEEFFAVPFPASNLIKINDDEFLMLGLYDHAQINLDGLTGAEREEAIAKIEEEKDYEVLDELPFWFNGRGFINKLRHRVYLVNIKTGVQTPLSPAFLEVRGMKYLTATDEVLYFGAEYESIKERPTRLTIRSIHTEKERDIALGKLFVRTADYVGDTLLISGTTDERYGPSENSVFYRVDETTGELITIADPDIGIGSSVSSDCRYGGGRSTKATKDALYYTETINFSSYIAKMTVDGKTQIISPMVNGCIDCFDLNNDQLIYIAVRNQGLQEIYSCTMDGKETKLTSFNDEYLQTHSVQYPKHFTFTNTDGFEIDGWVIEPLHYDPNKTYPGILEVHGGPKVAYGDVFFHEMQYLANEGYFVFFCNPRGADGKGNVFADIRFEKYGVIDFNDLMEFTDEVLKRYPQIDQSRIGMAGGSYGGFMANWIIGHTDRFAAVASQRSIANYISKCLTSDIGYFHNPATLGATPWTDLDTVWHHSPLKYADKVKTPTLFIQSDEDFRCWMADPIQMMNALRLHGVPTRMCLFHGENHELSRSGKPKHRVRRLQEIINWFNTYLKK